MLCVEIYFKLLEFLATSTVHYMFYKMHVFCETRSHESEGGEGGAANY